MIDWNDAVSVAAFRLYKKLHWTLRGMVYCLNDELKPAGKPNSCVVGITSKRGDHLYEHSPVTKS
jgi:hypothetical protein